MLFRNRRNKGVFHIGEDKLLTLLGILRGNFLLGFEIMEYQNNHASARGRRGRGRASKPYNRIREDMWAYELIASSSIQPLSSAREATGYYLDAKTLLQKLYPGVYQSWEKFKRDNCGEVNAADIPMNTEAPLNGEFDYSHFEEDDNKNILLLANVADVRHAREAQSYGFGSSGDYSLYDLDESTSYSSNYCPEDSKSNIKLFPNVTIKCENDSSTYMCI